MIPMPGGAAAQKKRIPGRRGGECQPSRSPQTPVRGNPAGGGGWCWFPRALSLETGKRNAVGLNEYLVIYGTARITEEARLNFSSGSPAKLSRSHVRFPPMDNPPPGYITHIRVDRVSGVGPRAAQR